MKLQKLFLVISLIALVFLCVYGAIDTDNHNREKNGLKKEIVLKEIKIDELNREITYLKEAKINNASLQEEIRAKAEGIIFETLGINQKQIKFTNIETNVDGFHVYVHMYLSGTNWKDIPEDIQKGTLTLVSKSFIDIVVKNSNVKEKDVKMNVDLQTASDGIAAGIYENGNIFVFQ